MTLHSLPVTTAAGAAPGNRTLPSWPPEHDLIRALGDKHGRDLENWWREQFGFGFECLTRSEARYLEKSADAQAIRDRLIEAGLKRGSGAPESGPESVAPSD
jgi:hypothetical protein